MNPEYQAITSHHYPLTFFSYEFQVRLVRRRLNQILADLYSLTVTLFILNFSDGEPEALILEEPPPIPQESPKSPTSSASSEQDQNEERQEDEEDEGEEDNYNLFNDEDSRGEDITSSFVSSARHRETSSRKKLLLYASLRM